MHDFAVTEDYVVFHTIPIVSSWERLEKRLPHFGFDTTLPIYLGVLPRKGGTAKDMRWFTAPNCFGSHVMNAFNDGTKIYFDIPEAKNNVFPFFPDVRGTPFDAIAGRPFLTRWTVDMASKSDQFEKREKLSDWIDEFPRIDDRYATFAYRHGWMLVMDPDMPFEGPGGRISGFVMNKIAHIDLQTGKQDAWWAGPQSICQEPCFIPRHKDSAEGDGYLIALVDNLITNYTDLVILDALKLSEGPIARAMLPIRLRSGLHGNYADESLLPKKQ